MTAVLLLLWVSGGALEVDPACSVDAGDVERLLALEELDVDGIRVACGEGATIQLDVDGSTTSRSLGTSRPPSARALALLIVETARELEPEPSSLKTAEPAWRWVYAATGRALSAADNSVFFGAALESGVLGRHGWGGALSLGWARGSAEDPRGRIEADLLSAQVAVTRRLDLGSAALRLGAGFEGGWLLGRGEAEGEVEARSAALFLWGPVVEVAGGLDLGSQWELQIAASGGVTVSGAVLLADDTRRLGVDGLYGGLRLGLAWWP